MNAMLQGRIAKHLNGLIRYDGVVMTNHEFYKQLVSKGYTPYKRVWHDGTISYQLKQPDNNFYEIPKIIHDNFMHVLVIA